MLFNTHICDNFYYTEISNFDIYKRAWSLYISNMMYAGSLCVWNLIALTIGLTDIAFVYSEASY